MYRVQLSGGNYVPNRQVGLHYQIHRGIGVHHQLARAAGRPFRVSVFVGGHPAMSVAAVMPLPEGMTELGFAGALAGWRIPLVRHEDALVYADADFCVTGTVDPDQLLPEGPFGDHLGYYSLRHDFPVLNVEHVSHRDGAIWPFTVVGRPPQEDTMFGKLIHELTGPVIPHVLAGVQAVHAVDAAGVHPLLLAIGSERYTPFHPIDQPQEILTQANAILGQGQLSLAKYLWILDGVSCPGVDIDDISSFLQRVLERVDWARDVHFQTQTTIDTLDYSGSGWNRGSKVVIAAAGPPRRSLGRTWGERPLPAGFHTPRIVLPGVLAISGPPFPAQQHSDPELAKRLFNDDLAWSDSNFPLVVVVDDSAFAAEKLENFLWVAFTRSNPAADIDGRAATIRDKHWGCRNPLVIDARIKPHHASVLQVAPETANRIDALAAAGGPLAHYL
jgi:4-hydroxy-3-polyprenylbenzoate decarboxylase